MKYKIKQDGDGHWYKIPANKEFDFENWLNLDSDNEASWTPPDFTIPIDNPEDYEFEEYTLKLESAIDLDNFKSNSLIVAKIDESVLNNAEMVEGLKRLIAELKVKVNIDDSTHLFITAENFDVKGFTEEDMGEMGWIKRN